MKPILLICGCNKYKETLINAIKRFKHINYKIIGILGDPDLPTELINLNIGDAELSASDSILLRLKVEDTYEALPFKIQSALAWISENYPKAPGVFKTDDDLFFETVDILAGKIKENKELDYWGVVRDCCGVAQICGGRIASRYTDTNLRPLLQAATYCYGAGYWVSMKSIKAIANSKKVCYGSEDVMMGSILNESGFYPEWIPIPWREEPR